MTIGNRPRLFGWRGALAVAIATAGTAVLGYFSIFSIFIPWDDEGYMLVSLRAYTAGGVLYRDVFTQYGPFYYELVGNVLRTIGHPVTMDDGRLFTLVVWTFTGLLMGLAVAQLTRSLALSIASQLLAFFALTAVTKEPLHPQGIIALLCAGMAAIAAAASRTRLRYALGALGALAAAALLTKVNVGGLALLALVFACAAAFSSGGALRSVACFGVGATPLLLMAPDLRHESFMAYAIVVALGLLALGTAACISVQEPLAGAEVVGFGKWMGPSAVGAGTAALLVIGIILLQGVTPRALINALVVDPARQREMFAAPLPLPSWSIAWSVLSFAIACRWSLSQRRRANGRDSQTTDVAKLAVGFALWLTLLVGRPAGLAVAVTLAWYAAVPVDVAVDRVDVFKRMFIGALAVLGSLQAYPVAGSQIALALVLFVPLVAIALADGWNVLDARARSGRAGSSSRKVIAGAAALATALFAWLLPLREYEQRYYENVPLRIAAADGLRLPAFQAQSLRSLVWMLKQQCSTFITYPGMNSLYVMTGMQPPTGLNTTSWMFQLDSAAQQRVVDVVARIPRLCVVRNQELIDFWRTDRIVPDRPLVRYIDDAFRIAWSNGNYDVLVRK